MRSLRHTVGWALGCSLAVGLFFSGAAAAAEREPKIVGGSPASIGDFPWQVAMAYDASLVPGGSGFERQFCGGTLVAPTIVITAAHCVFNNPPPPPDGPGISGFNPASSFDVFVGRTNLDSGEGEEIQVAEIYYFEGTPGAPVLRSQSSDPDKDSGQLFNLNTLEWDAVFVELAEPAGVGTAVRIAGPGEEFLWGPGSPALISGWGSFDPDSGAGDFPNDLRAAQVAIVDDASCATAYSSVPGSTIFTDTMVCAGVFPGGGIDTCSGDSGGPLVVRAEVGSQIGVRLVGDTSWGEGCAQPNFPGVYGRLASDPMRSAFRAGIQQVAGVDVVGAGARAIAPPETRLNRKPKKTKRTNRKRVKAKFGFKASEPGTFECRLDSKRFKRCSSPYKKKVGRGRHTFTVRAVDLVGHRDSSAERFRWRVRPKR